MAIEQFHAPAAGGHESFGAQVVDFGKGFFHGGVEDPVNALIEAANKTTGAHLPKLDIVGEGNHTIGSDIGNIAGKIVDVAALSYGMSKVYGAAGWTQAGALNSALRLGTTGFIYGSALTPSGGDGTDFFANRLKNGAIDFGTFAVMPLAQKGLEATPTMFLARGARPLYQDMVLFGGVGAVGGATNSELTNLLHNNRFSTSPELLSATETGAAFGAAFGAVSHAMDAHASSRATAEDARPNKVGYDKYSAEVLRRGPDGEPVRVQTHSEGLWGSTSTYEKMSNGEWRYTTKTDLPESEARDAFRKPSYVDHVTQAKDGSITIKNDAFEHLPESVQTYSNNGYESHGLLDVHTKYGANGINAATRFDNPRTWSEGHGNGTNMNLTTEWNEQSRVLQAVSGDPLKGSTEAPFEARFKYGTNGDVTSMSGHVGDTTVQMTQNAPGHYSAVINGEAHDFNGSVNASIVKGSTIYGVEVKTPSGQSATIANGYPEEVRAFVDVIKGGK